MNTKFNSLPWHDAELRSISIDRSDAGNSDTVELVVKWPNGIINCITFSDCFSFDAQMNFGIVAEETILDAVCLVESDKISAIKDKWAPLGAPLESICSYRLSTNSTNGQIEICAMSYTLEEVVLGS